MKLKELLNTNLDGWKLTLGYFVHLHVSVIGFYPLVEGEYSGKKRKIVVALTPEALYDVWKSLPPRDIRLTQIWVMVNDVQQLCIPVDGIEQLERTLEEGSEDYYFLHGEQASDVVFEYADSGLLSLKDQSTATFPWPKAA